MRAVLGLLLALALWGASLWWGFPVVPWEVTLRPLRRPVASQGPAPGPRWLHAEVVRSVPELDGLAVGDQVQWDRYGVLAPVAGTQVCVPVLATGGPLAVTPIGGGRTYAGVVRLTLVPPGTPGCDATELEPVLPRHP